MVGGWAIQDFIDILGHSHWIFLAPLLHCLAVAATFPLYYSLNLHRVDLVASVSAGKM